MDEYFVPARALRDMGISRDQPDGKIASAILPQVAQQLTPILWLLAHRAHSHNSKNFFVFRGTKHEHRILPAVRDSAKIRRYKMPWMQFDFKTAEEGTGNSKYPRAPRMRSSGMSKNRYDGKNHQKHRKLVLPGSFLGIVEIILHQI